jgi:peptide/nickel transport system permease protein
VRFRRYALERIGAALGVFCLAVVGIFVICHVIGPMELRGSQTDPRVYARYLSYVHESFGDYLWRLLSGSLAPTLYGPRLGGFSITDATLVTLAVVGWTVFIGLLIAVPLGFLWDGRPRWTRLVAVPFVYLAASLLTVWVALKLGYYLGFKWDIFPISGYVNFFDDPIQWAYHLILPAFVLCLPFAAIYTRVVRASFRNVRRARAEAPPEERDRAVGVARRAGLITITKGLLRDIGYLIGFALFAEVAFQLPGLGLTLELATFNADTPVIESVLVFATLVAVGIHLAGTLVGGALSKQWRLGA